MGKRILRSLKEGWNYMMYIVMIAATLYAASKPVNIFVIIIAAALGFAVVGEVIIDYLLKCSNNSHNPMSKTLTSVNKNGDYTLAAEDLYEAIEKLGYIEHEKGEY